MVEFNPTLNHSDSCSSEDDQHHHSEEMKFFSNDEFITKYGQRNPAQSTKRNPEIDDILNELMKDENPPTELIKSHVAK
jgi:hypothetical protein